jgi:hypothetical protein
MNSPWEGEWRKRIESRVKEKGYQDLIDFSEKNQSLDFFQLTDLLGERIAPIQVEQLLSEAYYEKGQYTRYFRSSLARHIRDSLPQGWVILQNIDIQLSCGIRDWDMKTPDEYNDFKEKVRKVLTQCNFIPKGWLPSGPDDPIVLQIFEEAGFKEVEIVR